MKDLTIRSVSKESLNVVEEKINALRQVIPECFIEGQLRVDKLENMIGRNLDRNDDKYSFNWAGRNDAFRIIQTSSEEP